jgi:hypothetical protein
MEKKFGKNFLKTFESRATSDLYFYLNIKLIINIKQSFLQFLIEVKYTKYV